MSNVTREMDVISTWERGESSQQSGIQTHELYNAASTGDVALSERLLASQAQTHAQAQPATASSPRLSMSNEFEEIYTTLERGEHSQQQTHVRELRVQINPQLYKAASTGDVALLEQLLGSPVQTHAQAQPDETAINVAPLEHGTYKLLLGKTHAGDTALHIATCFGHHDVAKRICDEYSFLFMPENDKGETPLHYAAQAGNCKLVTLFIQHAEKEGDNVVSELLRKINRDGETALYQGIHHCQVLDDDNFYGNFLYIKLHMQNTKPAREADNTHVEVVRELLKAELKVARLPDDSGRAPPASTPNNNSISPLYLAIMQNSLRIVEDLVEHWKKLPIRQNSIQTHTPSWEKIQYSGPDGQTAMHAAALRNKGFIDAVIGWKLELTKATDDFGSTPLHYAASANNLEAVKLLLEKDKTSAYIADASGLYPIHVAAKLGSELIVAEFFEQCPDSDELLDRAGRNFLHLAVEEKNESVVRWVCEKSKLMKAINSQDNEGDTPMHLAVKAQDVNIFSLLLGSKKTLKCIVNKYGFTSLDVAVGNRMVGLFHMQHPTYKIMQTLYSSGCSSGIHRRDHFNFINNLQMDPEKKEKEAQDLENMAKSMAIGSTLIASAAFAGTFTVSSAYRDESNSGHTKPELSLAFKAFVLMSAYAFICAIATTALVVQAAITHLDPKYRKKYAVLCSQFVMEATRSFIVAFALGVLVMMIIVSQWRLAFAVCLICSVLLVFLQPHFLPNILVQRALIRYLGIKRYTLVGGVGGVGFCRNMWYAIIVLLVLLAGRLSAHWAEHVVMTIIVLILLLISSPLFLPPMGYIWNLRPKAITIRIEKRFFLVILLSLVTYLVLFFPFDHLKGFDLLKVSWSKLELIFLVLLACLLLQLSFGRSLRSLEIMIVSNRRNLLKMFFSNPGYLLTCLVVLVTFFGFTLSLFMLIKLISYR